MLKRVSYLERTILPHPALKDHFIGYTLTGFAEKCVIAHVDCRVPLT